MCDKFKVNGAIARRSLRELLSKNLIKQVGDHHASFTLYTGAQAKAAAAEAAAAAAKKWLCLMLQLIIYDLNSDFLYLIIYL